MAIFKKRINSIIFSEKSRTHFFTLVPEKGGFPRPFQEKPTIWRPKSYRFCRQIGLDHYTFRYETQKRLDSQDDQLYSQTE